MVSEKIFFSIMSPWEQMTPWGLASLHPSGMFGRIYVEDHQTFLHTKSVSSGPYGLSKEDFLRFFSYTVLYKYITPCGVASLGPRGFLGRI